MLLGILLHGLLSFMEMPIWPAQDIHRNTPVYGFAFHAIHGFRMPLFFLISGFFTAMLWRRRGLRALVAHRSMRVLVPLVIGWFAFVPLLFFIGHLGNLKKQAIAAAAAESGAARGGEPAMPAARAPDLWAAARSGDVAAVDESLGAGADIDARDGAGITALSWATMLGRADAVEALIDRGADVNATNDDGSTSLHGAAFFGREDCARLLLEGGADPDARNGRGETPLDSSRGGREIVAFIAGLLEIEVPWEEVEAGRPGVVALIEEGGGSRGGGVGLESWIAGLPPAVQGIAGLYALGAFFPVFHHLWFLYYLLWLVAGFVAIAWLATRLGWRPLPDWVLASRWRLAWLVPLTLVPQVLMTQTFGPDTAGGLLPWPPKLLYYGIFFAFGAIAYGKPAFFEEVGRRWVLCLAAAIPFLMVGLHALEARAEDPWRWHLVLSVSAAGYAWLVAFGLIGLFRAWFPGENRRIRYISDSSYWLYLAHLPVIIALQIWVSDWNLPSGVKLVLVCGATFAGLLIAYEFAVRYTWVGALLNGRKARSSAPEGGRAS